MAGHDVAESLWRYSLMVYARPGVADALIRLYRDRGGHNVNLVPLRAVASPRARAAGIDAAELARARMAIAGLDQGEIVAPLAPAASGAEGRSRPGCARVAAARAGAGNRGRAMRPGAPLGAASDAQGGARRATARVKLAERGNLRLILGEAFRLGRGGGAARFGGGALAALRLFVSFRGATPPRTRNP